MSTDDRPVVLAAAVAQVRGELGDHRPRVAIVLGSGLGGLTARVTSPRVIDYAGLPGFHLPTVAGHKGELVAGTLAGTPVILQNGRFHMYEGHSAAQAALPTRLFAALGCETMIVTNAAGGLNPEFGAGTLMVIRDHLNLTGRNPLDGPVMEAEARFPDMSEAYDGALRGVALRVGRDLGTPLQEGIYAGLLGPNYETPAEVRMLRTLGADAVGMSTVVEVIAARALGMRCLGISLISNAAAGIANTTLSHGEVMAAAAAAGGRLGSVIEGVVATL